MLLYHHRFITIFITFDIALVDCRISISSILNLVNHGDTDVTIRELIDLAVTEREIRPQQSILEQRLNYQSMPYWPLERVIYFKMREGGMDE